MKLLVLIAFLFLLVGGGYLLATYMTAGAEGVKKALRRREAVRKGRYILNEESDGEQVVVYCVDVTDHRKKLLVGAAPFAAQDFDMQLEILRSEGRQKLLTLNNKPILGR